MDPKGADGMASSVDPDQTAPLYLGLRCLPKTHLSKNLGTLWYKRWILQERIQNRKIEPRHEKPCFCHMRSACTSAQSDQRLCYSLLSKIPLVSISKISRRQLVFVGEQASLSCTWLQTPKTSFSWQGSSLSCSHSSESHLPSVYWNYSSFTCLNISSIWQTWEHL